MARAPRSAPLRRILPTNGVSGKDNGKDKPVTGSEGQALGQNFCSDASSSHRCWGRDTGLQMDRQTDTQPC